MQPVVQQLIARPLRYVAKFVLQRPRLKKCMRDMVMRMPGVHVTIMRMMFQAPVSARSKISIEQENLSSNARRNYRALTQAIRNQR